MTPPELDEERTTGTTERSAEQKEHRPGWRRFPLGGNVAFAAACVLLIGYIGFLVSTNYLWQVRLRDLAIEKSRYEIKQQAKRLSYFLSERKEDLRNIARRRELAAFFENKALGMSMEYGLEASLLIASRSFKEFVSTRNIEHREIYTRLVFIDTSGKPLLDTLADSKKGTSKRDWTRLLQPGLHDPEIRIVKNGSSLEMLVTLSYYYKNEYTGQIVAWISPCAAYHLIDGWRTGPKRLVHIVFKRSFLPFEPGAPCEALPAALPGNLGRSGRNVVFFKRPGPSGSPENMLAIAFPVQNTPLSVAAISKAADVLGEHAPWNMSLAMGILAVFILAGMALIFRTNTRNLVLRTRLEETERVRKEMEAKNLRLKNEIEHRIQAETNLRRETAINRALAEISNTILQPYPMEYLSSLVLKYAVCLTASGTGYAAYIDPENGRLVYHTWTRTDGGTCGKGNECASTDPDPPWGRLLRDGKPLVCNTPPAVPETEGSGNVPVDRFISVPALSENEFLGQLSLADANHDYTDEDLVTLQKLSALYAIAIQRKRDEAHRRRINIELEQKVRDRTAELAAAGERLRAEIEERKAAEHGLRKSEERMKRLIEASPIGIGINRGGCYVYVNPAFVKMFGYEDPEEILGVPADFLAVPECKEFFSRQRATAPKGNTASAHELKGLKKNGEHIDVAVWETLVDYEGEKATLHYVVDISEERKLTAQLLQAQKMEAVGRLAGGVAHDFNNLLTTIQGNAELIMMDLNPSDLLYTDALEIKKAGKRAAALTRQLLAFSRKQVLQPRVVNVNDVFTEMEKMLARMIGEDIEIVKDLDPGIGRVKVDPGQMEQVLMNLAVNARDAMPFGGRITVATGEVHVDAGRARESAELPDIAPGSYVTLSLSDTGVGMDPETREHIFEPFFTTKERGKGTGLGLSTVYGIVKQSGGHIHCHSVPHEGTTFTIYLPRVEEQEEDILQERIDQLLPGGSETVLVVEDDDSVRALALHLLKKQEYTVLEARDGKEALEVCDRYNGSIHLLLTDVIMPRMNGRELEKCLKDRYPNLKIVFMSGYADDTLMHHNVTDRAVTLLQKPFTPATLLKTLRHVLDS